MSAIVRRIQPEESLPLRALRLRALADAPLAFGSTLAREQAVADEVWRERAKDGATGRDRVTYVAEDGGQWVGMVTGITDDPSEPRRQAVGMFVAPAARGQGMGAAVHDAVVAWARERGAVRLRLWVTTTNHAAIRLYHRCGFRPSDRTKPKPLDHTPSLSEIEMIQDLAVRTEEPG